ncbi:MAG: succinate dehydrogenase, hydrophobic membrane anchor protein [Burkholderiales bacterium]|nr:succinate dehydrogenase, hydrophobic membrane anchor protein [Burkholderiales bacterium]
MAINYGSKRITVGAGYGFRDWLVQRVTAVLMSLFTFILLANVLLSKGEMGYDKWAGIFSAQWMKFITFALIVALIWHVWIGVRDIWMDYVKPVGVRLALHVLSLIWLLGCGGWAVQVLWRL